MTRDDHFLLLRWQQGGETLERLAPLNNSPFKLYLELEQPRPYALRADADLAYRSVPETSLTGEYIPNACD